MNNLTFGDEQMGYYETIAGGAGAGPHWNGRSGVHTHMTNTRITDPEIFERRFPVVLHEFSLREGSGGQGEYRGGDGVVREVTAMNSGSDRQILVYNPDGRESGKTHSQSFLLSFVQPKHAMVFIQHVFGFRRSSSCALSQCPFCQSGGHCPHSDSMEVSLEHEALISC